MANVKGYNGKILRVNLSNGTTTVETPDEDFYKLYVGGVGFIAYFLLKELKGGEDPLGPENKIIFAGGPVTGATIAGARHSIGAKSPLTGAFGSAEAGGFWGHEMSRAGFDAIIVEGKADKPVYIWVKDGKAEIKDAANVWGKEIVEADKIIRQELGDDLVRIASCGIAGENMVRFASVMNDGRDAAGRTGMGAVMGSKNLRAIAVRGSGNVEPANPAGIRAMANHLRNSFANAPYGMILSQMGTGGMLGSMINSMGDLPTHNYQEDVFEHANKITGTAFGPAIVKKEGCFACPIRCKMEVSIGEPWNVDVAYGGPEYEGLAALGSLCLVSDINAVAKANERCNAYGMDVISCGSTIAFAMECFEKGALSEKDTGGVKITFGDAQALVKAVEMIARKEGFGATLSEGVARAAKAIGKGAEKFAIHVKGEEVPMHVARVQQGMGLGYALSPTGADHVHNFMDMGAADQGSMPGTVYDLLGIGKAKEMWVLDDEKAQLTVTGQQWAFVLDTLVMCMFPTMVFTPPQLVKIVNDATGWKLNVRGLIQIGERALTMARLFNNREGFTKADDMLPERFFTPLPSGPFQGMAVNREAFDKAVGTYYQLMGWDKAGKPTKAKLEELGVGWAA